MKTQPNNKLWAECSQVSMLFRREGVAFVSSRPCKNGNVMEAFSLSPTFLAKRKYAVTVIKCCVHLRYILSGKKKRNASNDFSEVSRLSRVAIVLVLQLVVLPHRALGTITSFLFHHFFRFSLSAKKNTAQLRFAKSRAPGANAHFRVLRRIRNHHTHFQLHLHFRVQTKNALRI